MLYKRGRYYWLDVSINGKRIRRSLKTTKKLEAISTAGDLKEELIAQHSKGKILFSDFCEQYLEWAWSSKPASTLREKQRLEKIQEFFKDLDVLYLDDITPYHIEQLKAELKRTGIDFHFHLLRHYFTTSLVEKGVDFITISEILGHSKLTTSLIYSHTDKERKKRAV
ncbi:MAG: tyrosine-type recombinase/integrase, partial [Nitrospirota bacterium]|nr:tyrosine-type recombinase/integrase [Nitrospirota bacterium]